MTVENGLSKFKVSSAAVSWTRNSGAVEYRSFFASCERTKFGIVHHFVPNQFLANKRYTTDATDATDAWHLRTPRFFKRGNGNLIGKKMAFDIFSCKFEKDKILKMLIGYSAMNGIV